MGVAGTIYVTVIIVSHAFLRSSGGNLRIHEVTVSEGSGIDGKTIEGSGLREKFGILVLASRDPGQTDIQFNPPASKTLTDGTTLMVVGDVENIAKARAIA